MTAHPRRAASMCLLLSCLLLSSCSQPATGTVDGVVLVNGEPTGGLEIGYYNDGDGSVALGATQADGRFTLRVGRGIKYVRVGDYHVTVTPSGEITGVPKPDIKMPAKYLDYQQTDLIQQVKPGANQHEIRIDL